MYFFNQILGLPVPKAMFVHTPNAIRFMMLTRICYRGNAWKMQNAKQFNMNTSLELVHYVPQTRPSPGLEMIMETYSTLWHIHGKHVSLKVCDFLLYSIFQTDNYFCCQVLRFQSLHVIVIEDFSWPKKDQTFCEGHYGRYNNVLEAQNACTLDPNCTAITDFSCNNNDVSLCPVNYIEHELTRPFHNQTACLFIKPGNVFL